jgi:hypothetical protein
LKIHESGFIKTIRITRIEDSANAIVTTFGSEAQCMGARKAVVSGAPEIRHISTSQTERQNLSMRMSMRRFTRLTNAFSKNLENHQHAVALYFMYYNFVRIHQSLATECGARLGERRTFRKEIIFPRSHRFVSFVCLV